MSQLHRGLGDLFTSLQPHLIFEIASSLSAAGQWLAAASPITQSMRHALCCPLQVFHQDVLASLLAPDSAQYAVRTAHEVFTAYQQSHMSLPDIFQEHDALGLSEGMAGAHARASSKGARLIVGAARCRPCLPEL